MTQMQFTPDGDTLSAEIVCDPKRDGDYELRHWDRSLNKVLERWPGNFLNTADDKYDLPDPPSVNDKRFLQCFATIGVPKGAGPARVTMIVRQGSAELGRESKLVPPDDLDHPVQLWIRLLAAGTP